MRPSSWWKHSPYSAPFVKWSTGRTRIRRSSPSPLWPNLASTCAKISRTFPRHSTWGVNGEPGVEIWVAKCWETPKLQWILAIWIQWLKLGTSRKRLLLVFFFLHVLVEIHTCLHDYCMGPMSGCLAKPGLGNRQCTIWWLDIPKRFDSGLKLDHDLECEGSEAKKCKAASPTTGKMLILWHSHHAIGAGQTSSLHLLHISPGRDFRSEGKNGCGSLRMWNLSRCQPAVPPSK